MNAPYVDTRTSVSGNNDEFHFRDVIGLAFDHAGTIIATAAIMFALAAAYVFLATPIYSGNVLVRVVSPDPNALGIAPQGQVVAQQPAPVTDAEIAMMQTRAVVGPVVEKYGFDITVTPRTIPFLGLLAQKLSTPGKPSRAWFGLESHAWGGELVDIKSLTVPDLLENRPLTLRVLDDSRYELLDPAGDVVLTGMTGRTAASAGISILVTRLIARPNTEFKVIRWNAVSAIQRFSRDLKVTEKGKETGLIEASFDNSDAALAARVVNSLADGYVEATVASHRLSDSKTLDFINGELPRLREELRQSEEQLTSYQMSASTLQPTAEALSYLQGGIDFQRQIAALQLQRTQLLQNYTDGSPQVATINQQLAQLTGAKASFDARFKSMPVSERQSIDLARNAKVAEAIYVAMVNKAEELTVRRAGTTGDVHIVDRALRPSDPVKPNRLLIMSTAAEIGLMLGLLFVFVRSRLFTGITDPMFVEHRLSVPVLGAVLYSPQQLRLDREAKGQLPSDISQRFQNYSQMLRARNNLSRGSEVRRLTDTRSPSARLPLAAHRVLALSYPHDLSVEALRSVQTALQFNVAEPRNNIVAVVGPTPSTGKSFVSANLAALEADAAKRVLLIDADMRGGCLASHFDQSNAGGLSELLAGTLTPENAIRSVGVPGLSFLSCGAYPPNPSALLMMPRFASLLQELNQQFDTVIVDTPPVLAVSDAAIIANSAGTAVLVLRSGMQTEVEIGLTLTKLQRAGTRVVGAVFNAVPVRRSDRRGYGYAAAYTRHQDAAA